MHQDLCYMVQPAIQEQQLPVLLLEERRIAVLLGARGSAVLLDA